MVRSVMTENLSDYEAGLVLISATAKCLGCGGGDEVTYLLDGF